MLQDICTHYEVGGFGGFVFSWNAGVIFPYWERKSFRQIPFPTSIIQDRLRTNSCNKFLNRVSMLPSSHAIGQILLMQLTIQLSIGRRNDQRLHEANQSLRFYMMIRDIMPRHVRDETLAIKDRLHIRHGIKFMPET